MYYTQDNKPKKRFGLLIALVIVFALALGSVITYTVIKINEPERVPGRLIEKTLVQYNVSDDAQVQIAKNNLISTVSIEVSGNGDIYSGTGFIVDFTEDTSKNARYPIIMTNYHVISAADKSSGYVIKIKLFDKANFFDTYADIIGFDSEIDIAVLRLKVDLQDVENRIVKFGNSRDLQYAQKVIAIGNALGGGLSVTSGEISIPEVVETITLTDEYSANGTTQHFIQTSAAINSGNSGGILLDMVGVGRVIGINTYKVIADNISSGGVEVDIPADNIGLAVPSNMAVAILDYIKSKSNNYTQIVSEVKAARNFELNFKSLVADIDDNYNNVLKASQNIKFGLGIFPDISKDETITKINDIDIDKFHTGMPIPSASIFSELILYYGTSPNADMQDNRFYLLKLTVEGNEKTVSNLFLQREIPWMQDFLGKIEN